MCSKFLCSILIGNLWANIFDYMSFVRISQFVSEELLTDSCTCGGTMSKNITTTAAALTKQGISEGTVTTAVSGITRGMGTVGTNTTKLIEDRIKKGGH